MSDGSDWIESLSHFKVLTTPFIFQQGSGGSDIEDLSREKSEDEVLSSSSDEEGGGRGANDAQEGLSQIRAGGSQQRPEEMGGSSKGRQQQQWQPGRPTGISLNLIQRERLDIYQTKVRRSTSVTHT